MYDERNYENENVSADRQELMETGSWRENFQQQNDFQKQETFRADDMAHSESASWAGHTEDGGSSWQTRSPKKQRRILKAAALALCCITIGAAGSSVIKSLNGSSETTLQIGSNHTIQAVNLSSVDTSTELTASELYEKYVNSTVGITTSITTNYWGFETESAASGSGFILTADGYILTNYHVIEDSSEITVTAYNGTTYEATLVGYDESNDIAVLKVDASGLTPVVLGDSDSLKVGDSVAAIGNPLGELTFSLTTGIVSAKDRQITLSSGVTMNLIQTDCAINSGNSGGALFNMYGEVIGITNAKYGSSSSGTSVDNIAFAIPISDVLDVVQSIMKDGTIATPYIGVTVQTTGSELQGYGLPAGAVISAVTEGSPAENAGLQENDIITAAGDTEITSATDLTAVIKKCSEGDVLTLTVYRQRETISVDVTVGTQTKSALGEDEDSDSDSDESYGSSSGSNPSRQDNEQNMPWGGYGSLS